MGMKQISELVYRGSSEEATALNPCHWPCLCPCAAYRNPVISGGTRTELAVNPATEAAKNIQDSKKLAVQITVALLWIAEGRSIHYPAVARKASG